MTEPSAAAVRRVYLDNAATAWPKSAAALAAAEEFSRQCGATSGRGAYRSALQADRWLVDARVNLARLVGASSGQAVALCNSGTHALNAALWGLLRPGQHVISSGMDHNSLLRPLKHLETHHGLRLTIVPSDVTGFADPRQAAEHITAETRWIAIGHASNVTGRVQDLEGWSELARKAGAKLIVDASQTLGYLPIDMHRDGVDVLAAAGHKGLRALAGTGLLVVERELQSQLRALMYGGTGLASEQLADGQEWPQSVEVGNLNLPGIVSMAVAAEEVAQNLATGMAAWRAVYEQLLAGLAEMPAVRLVGWGSGQPSSVDRIPVVSLQAAGWAVHDLASVLDTSFGIEVRAGWHCAALVHDTLGTATGGGTLRLSPGPSTTAAEIDWTLSAFKEILS